MSVCDLLRRWWGEISKSSPETGSTRSASGGNCSAWEYGSDQSCISIIVQVKYERYLSEYNQMMGSAKTRNYKGQCRSYRRFQIWDKKDYIINITNKVKVQLKNFITSWSPMMTFKGALCIFSKCFKQHIVRFNQKEKMSFFGMFQILNLLSM